MGKPCGDDLAVILDSDPPGFLRRGSAEVDDHSATAAEGGVEASACVVAGNRPALVANGGGTCHDDLPVVLDGNRISYVLVETEIGCLLATAAEGSVEGAVAGVANNGEVTAKTNGKSRHDDLAVVLDGDCVAL